MAIVNVNFGVYPLAIGNRTFYPAGTQRLIIRRGQTVQVTQPLAPDKQNYPSVRVTIDFGQDSDFSNNISQRSIASVSPASAGSVYDVQIVGYPQRMRDHDARQRILRERERRGGLS